MREELTNTLQSGFRTLTDDVPATALVHNCKASKYTGGHGSLNGLLLVLSTTYAPASTCPANFLPVPSPSKVNTLMAESLANASQNNGYVLVKVGTAWLHIFFTLTVASRILMGAWVGQKFETPSHQVLQPQWNS